MEERIVEKMRIVLGYRKGDGKVYGFAFNTDKYQKTVNLLKMMTSLGEKFMKEYIRLQGGSRLREYDTNINKIPVSIKRMLIYERGKITEDNLVTRRILVENNPLNQLSDEEREILGRIQNGER